MDDKNTLIPFFIVEAMMTRAERIIKMLLIINIIVIALLFASNGIWLYSWQQYDYGGSEQVVTVDGKDGNANYIGNDGDITNGPDSSSEANTVETEEERQIEGDEGAED